MEKSMELIADKDETGKVQEADLALHELIGNRDDNGMVQESDFDSSYLKI